MKTINLSSAPRELKPIVAAIDDWTRNWRLGVIFECNVGKGRLLVSAIPLQSVSSSTGVQQLRRSLLDYMASEHFHPAINLSPEQVRSLWHRGAAPTATPAKREFDPDLNDGSTRKPPAQIP